MADHIGTVGRDRLTLINDEDDSFAFTPQTLTRGDAIFTGHLIPSPSGRITEETLILGPGTYAPDALNYILGTDRVILQAGGVNVILTSSFGQYSYFGRGFTVEDGSGDDRVDASRFGSGVVMRFMGLAGGNDTVIGGAGADVFTFDSLLLTGEDVVTGGAGFDRLVIQGAGALAADALRQVTSIEAIEVTGAPQALTFTDVQVESGMTISGASLVDASALTGRRHVIIEGLADGTYLGGEGFDSFRFAPGALGAGVRIDGGGGTDALILTAGGAVGALTQVSSIERIELAPDGNAILVPDTLLEGLFRGTLSIIGGDGDDSIDASALAAPHRIEAQAGGGADRILGGAGDDLFRIAPDALTGADTLDGGAGQDMLLLTAGGSLLADALAQVQGIERLQFSGAGNAVALSETFALAAGGLVLLVGGDGADSIDGSALVTGRMDALGGAGADLLIAGAGKDRLRGGADADVFLFGSAAASSPEQRDSIMDFDAAEGDRIDLSGVSGGLLDFIGGGPFTAAGQLRVTPRGASEEVSVNLDADMAAEMVILVRAGAPLIASDFLL